MKHLFDLVYTESMGGRREIVVTAAISGLANASIVAIVGEASQTAAYDNINLRYLLLFMLAMTLYVMCQRYSAKRMVLITTRIVQTLRVRVVGKVQASELPVLDRIGKSRIANALSRDANLIGESGEALIDGLQSLVFVAFAFAYIAWLSRPAFFLSLLSASVIMTIVMRQQARTQVLLRRGRDREVEFLNYVTDAIDGFKEARINTARREDLHKDIIAASERVTVVRQEVEGINTNVTILSRASIYMLIAVVVFLLPAVVQTYSEVITETITAILFMVGPLGLLVGITPYLARANDAARAIGLLEEQLDAENGAVAAGPGQSRRTTVPDGPIVFDEVRYSYDDGNGDSFSLGPISFEIPRGEILFMTGGNGSGKSTLLKLLTGLYRPDGGRLFVGGVPVTGKNIQAYRETFSAVFSDFHLFRRLYGLLGTSDQAVNELLERMRLDRKVQFDDQRFSNLDLSTGQRKRLALVVTLLEDRPVLVFDELAAEQDPEFRQFLYEELLPGLKSKGRTVIAATHDDRYFEIADTVVKLDYGKVESVGPPDVEG